MTNRYNEWIEFCRRSLPAPIYERAKKKLGIGAAEFGETMYSASPSELKDEILDELADVVGWMAPFYDRLKEYTRSGSISFENENAEEILSQMCSAKNSLECAMDSVGYVYFDVLEACELCEQYEESLK